MKEKQLTNTLKTFRKNEYRLLNAADYGAHTSRVRYFVQFAKNDLPIVWPASTHSKKPGATLLPVSKQRLASVLFMDQQYGLSKPRSLEKPNNAVTANPKFNLVHANPWIMTTNFNNVGAPLSMVGIFKPGGEVPNPEFFSHPPSGNPEKNNQQVFALPFFENENMTMQKIRIFMAHFRIIDIKMRMLTIEELKLIQGFPKNYILKGTQTSQKKYIGNAVVPAVPKHMVEARVEKLNAWKINPVEDYVFA